MAYYRVLRKCSADGVLYQEGDVLDLGDDAYAGRLNVKLGGALAVIRGFVLEAAPAVVAETERSIMAAKPPARKRKARGAKSLEHDV